MELVLCSSITGSASVPLSGNSGPSPRNNTCFWSVPVTINPDINTLSPVSTSIRVEMLSSEAAAVGVGVAAGVAEGAGLDVGVAVGVDVGVGLGEDVGVGVGVTEGAGVAVAVGLGVGV